MNIKFVSLSALFVFVTCFAVAQRNQDGSMPQYLLPEFTDGKVLMQNGQILNEYMNYNTVTERMVYIKDEKYWDLANPQMVDTVYLDGRKFVPKGKYFNELLVKGKHSLFIQNKGTLMSAGAPVGYGGKSQLAVADVLNTVDLASGRYNLPIPDDFIVNPSPVYWIKNDSGTYEFTNEKQFLEIFGEEGAAVKEFMKKNKLRAGRVDHLMKIVSFLNLQ